jgi:hypothetical protein
MAIRFQKVINSIVAFDDHEIGEYTRNISKQPLGKHVLAATNRCATIEVLSEIGCFYVVLGEEL